MLFQSENQSSQQVNSLIDRQMCALDPASGLSLTYLGKGSLSCIHFRDHDQVLKNRCGIALVLSSVWQDYACKRAWLFESVMKLQFQILRHHLLEIQKLGESRPFNWFCQNFLKRQIKCLLPYLSSLWCRQKAYSRIQTRNSF